MLSQLQKMVRLAQDEFSKSTVGMKDKILEEVNFYKHMLGFHPKDKVLSLWDKTARAISKGKAGKSVEFGRRWIITRLVGGYVSGTTCQKIGADADTKIADEVIIDFLETFGQIPESFIYDRGADSKKNHQLLEGIGISNNCIFPKGRRKMNVTQEVWAMAKQERSLNESTIANLKSHKYNFTKPRARSTDSIVNKGYCAMLGFNLNLFLRDLGVMMEIKPEIT